MRRCRENDTRILFLDIDGVLTTWESNYCLLKEKLDLLEQIIKETGAKIVITSSWRRGNIERTKEFLTDPHNHHVGSNPFRPIDAVIGETLRLGLTGLEDSTSYTIPRGVEIQEWIERNDIWNYTILDDRSDMLFCQRGRCVFTDSDKGLGEREAKRIFEIFTSENPS